MLDMETGTHLGILIDAEVNKIKSAPQRKQVTQPAEPAIGGVIDRLYRAALPQLRADAKRLQRITAENELHRQRNERAAASQHFE